MGHCSNLGLPSEVVDLALFRGNICKNSGKSALFDQPAQGGFGGSQGFPQCLGFSCACGQNPYVFGGNHGVHRQSDPFWRGLWGVENRPIGFRGFFQRISREDGGDVAIFTHSEEHKIKHGSNDFGELQRCFACRGDWTELALDPMHLSCRNFQRLQQAGMHDSIVAVRMIWRNAPFIRPEKVNPRQGELALQHISGDRIEKILGDSAAGERCVMKSRERD